MWAALYEHGFTSEMQYYVMWNNFVLAGKIPAQADFKPSVFLDKYTVYDAWNEKKTCH